MAEFTVTITGDSTTVTCTTCGEPTTGTNLPLLVEYMRDDHTCPPIAEPITEPEPETRIANPTDDNEQTDTGATANPGTTITRHRPTGMGRGRTPDWTDHRITDHIIDSVAGGAYMTVAAVAAGIAKGTLFRWLQEAEAPDAPEELRDFRDRMTRARAMAEETAVEFLWDVARGGHLVRKSTRLDSAGDTVIDEAFTPPDAKPVMFLLERSFPQRWTRRSQLDVGLNPDGPARMQNEDDPERMEAMAERVSAALATVRSEVVHSEEESA